MPILAEVPGYPPLTDDEVSTLAGLYAWAEGVAVTPEAWRELATRLVAAWQQHDDASVRNALDAVELVRRCHEAMVADPTTESQLRSNAQAWLWDLEASPIDLAFPGWALSVGLSRPSSSASSHDAAVDLANASLLGHLEWMRSYRTDWA